MRVAFVEETFWEFVVAGGWCCVCRWVEGTVREGFSALEKACIVILVLYFLEFERMGPLATSAARWGIVGRSLSRMDEG